MNYSKALKDLREKLTLSQQEMAKFIGISYITYNRWENEHFKPTIKNQRILKELFKKYNIKAE